MHPTRVVRPSAVALALALAVLVGCGGPTGPAQGAARFLVVQQRGSPYDSVIEYTAPPLEPLRGMRLSTGTSAMIVALRDTTTDGFYAIAFPGTHWSPSTWQLVRFDGDWREAASVSAAAIIDTLSILGPPKLSLTPDGRHLAVLLLNPSNQWFVVDLDPVTLAVGRRTTLPLPPFYLTAPTGATGSEILLASSVSGSCASMPLAWLDVASGSVTASGTHPCNTVLGGALDHHDFYLIPMVNTPVLDVELYDGTSGAVTATWSTAVPPAPEHFLVSRGRFLSFQVDEVFELDPTTLTVLDSVSTDFDSFGPGSVIDAVTDPASGIVIGLSSENPVCPACQGSREGLVLFDPTTGTRTLAQPLAWPAALVP